MNRLNTNVNGIRSQIERTVRDLDSLSSIVQDKSQPVNVISNTFRTIKDQYNTNVTRKIESVQNAFAVGWVRRINMIDLNAVNATTTPTNFKSYKNIKVKSVNRGVPKLTRYPKLTNMRRVLESLDRYIATNTQRRTNENRARANEARKRNEAARTIQRAQRAKAARNEATRRAAEARAQEAQRNANNTRMRQNLAQSVAELKRQVLATEGNQFGR